MTFMRKVEIVLRATFISAVICFVLVIAFIQLLTYEAVVVVPLCNNSIQYVI